MSLEQLKARRKQIRRSITRFETFLNKFSDTDNIRTLKLRYKEFKPFLNTYNTLQDEIGVFEDLSETDKNERIADENKIYNLLASAEDKIEKQSILPSTSTTELKLPTINLPHFNGFYTEWTVFYDSFKSLIHENSYLENIQKLHYLRSCLGEEPRRIIESLSVSADSYHTAWKLLKERYQNKRLLVHHHIHSLFNLPIVNNKIPNSLRSLLDQANAHLESLKTQNIDIATWDAIIVYLISSKFDFTTKREWESKLTNNVIPAWIDLKDFLRQRCQTLESFEVNINGNLNATQPSKYSENNKRNFKNNISPIVSQNKCAKCKHNHYIYQCPAFLELSQKDKFEEAKNLKLCINCLRAGHNSKNCASRTCRTCSGKHHTLLHFHNQASDDNVRVNYHCESVKTNEILLSTAIIKVRDTNGQYHDARALLDVASQDNFISENFCTKLNLKQVKKNIPICGIGQLTDQISCVTNIFFKSSSGEYSENIQCLILPKITKSLPLESFEPNDLNIPENIALADSNFYLSAPIDILIGAALFYDLLREGRIKLNNDKTYIQNSALGWLVGGPYTVAVANVKTNRICYLTSRYNNVDLENLISKFWEIENFETNGNFTAAEEQCETLFRETFQRDTNGRFIVSLPFKNIPINIGSTKEIAIKRFKFLEAKFEKNNVIKEEYHKFLKEYVELGHMNFVENPEVAGPQQAVYLPHHAVIKETSLTTKTRVVFDASARSSNGLSLNDNLYAGPNLQADLFSVITRCRLHKYVLSADIKKMFRQIILNPNDRDFLRILYREDKRHSIDTYRLNTVTYGLNCAPYLAMRCLHELAHQAIDNYPQASRTILNCFYMDDLLVGIDSIAQGIILRDNLINILKQGQFELYKWASNNIDLLPNSDSTSYSSDVRLDSNLETKTLGLTWNCDKDLLKYQLISLQLPTKATKRNVLSVIAKVFDPLGLISPVLIIAKILLQKLWKLKLDWDTNIPTELEYSFNKFCQLLHLIDHLEIPRSVVPSTDSKIIQLHGFCDASKDAYGAVIYIRTIDKNDKITVHLLCSKSRVAPLKTLTIPRLELCAATLLSHLVSKVMAILDVTINDIYYWSDSQIALSWILAESSKWHIFVAHRVAQIQYLSKIEQWRYIPTELNPADLITRGMLPNESDKLNFWLHGPLFLLQQEKQWPTHYQTTVPDVPERRKVVLLTQSIQNQDIPVFHRVSTYKKLKRVIAYCLRFIKNCRHPNSKIVGQLTCDELQSSNNKIVEIVQNVAFNKEIQDLKSKRQINHKSNLTCLNVFLDQNNLLRVGGRLCNAPISYDMKHQLLLPKKHVVSKLIIRDAHISSLHGGIQASIATVRNLFWPLSIKSSTRKIIHNCTKCRHTKPLKYEQLMGNLPAERVTPARPFLNCGIDYAGPILLKIGIARGRTSKFSKAYVAVFVCLATKAIHLELVHDYTSESFLNALKRMMARRGKISTIFSDNGTNFVGANRELREIKALFDSNNFENDVVTSLTNDGITWKFIPPNSPYVGGIWEAGVKSFKNLFKRVAGNSFLVPEEMCTLLALIESCLNSRPITPISDDPNDLEPLTPGHFLIGCPLNAPAEVSLLQLPENRLSRWQRVERMRQEFWKRWVKEYLTELQRRNKWKIANEEPLKVGSLVILRDDNVPPLQWKMGRVVELHPGKDKIVRVISVKTISGVTKRAVNRVCELPVNID